MNNEYNIIPPGRPCSHKNFLDRPRTFSNGGVHTERLCSDCGAHIKFMPRKRFEEAVLYFGKYRGKLLRDVLGEDPGYVAWLIDKNLLPAWQKENCLEAMRG